MMRFLASCALLLSIAGCAAAPPDTEAGEASAPAEPVASRAVVRFAPDGTYKVEYSQVTAAEQMAELTGRAAADLGAGEGLGRAAEGIVSVDSSCTASDDWFFDQPTNHTLTNELCVYGSGGPLDLSLVCRGVGCTGYWNGVIQSYWTQASSGHFNSVSGSGDCVNFPVTTTQTNDGFAASANYLTLGTSCCTGTKQWCSCGGGAPCPGYCAKTLLECQNYCNNICMF